MLSIGLFWLALAFYLLAIFAKGVSKRWQRRNDILPPGPAQELLLGNIRHAPAENAAQVYMQWSKEHQSDILSLNMLGQDIIVLNSVRAAKDLLSVRSANYSNRPPFTLLEWLGFDSNIVVLPWGPLWRQYRRITQSHFLKSKIYQYRDVQQREVGVLLRNFMADPTTGVDHILARFSAGTVLGVIYGVAIENDESPYFKAILDSSYTLENIGSPFASLASFFPFVRYLPAWCHDRQLKFVTKWRPAVVRSQGVLFQASKELPVKTHNFVRELLDGIRQRSIKGLSSDLSEYDIKHLSHALGVAGYSSTWITMQVFILSMVLHPDVVAKAQKALDEVVGRDRLPSLDDQPNLPYIGYIVNEALRWIPSAPLGVAHGSLEDDEYCGFRIPTGSIVIPNTYAMTHDDKVYANPDAFDPVRYAPVAEGGRGEPFPEGVFGFGRRICPGRHLVENSLWMAMASLLSTMSFKRSLDDQGNPITPQAKVSDGGAVIHLASFPCQIKPRDEKSVELIKRISG